VRAQICTPTSEDGSPCDDDLDPCTDDRCDDGDCEHDRVGFPEACAPVLAPFQRVLVLTPFTQRLTVRMGTLPVGAPPAFTSGQRAALVADLNAVSTQLELARRVLAGLDPAVNDTAQARAAAVLPEAEEALRLATLVHDLVRSAVRAEQFDDPTANELERSSADLVRGVKALRRDLVRLRKVSQVFRP
jgi:hypothetical protein